MPSLRYETRAYQAGARVVCGIDEAGRGPLAGPVVAAAVILPRDFRHRLLTDSKLLTEREREQLYEELTGRADIVWAVGVSEVAVIEQYNILGATWRAMQLALDHLAVRPDHALIDGRPAPLLGVKQTAIVGGDLKSYSIAAASVIAKVSRDRHMRRLHALYPGYGFDQHKGYCTPEHLAALQRLGPCPVHRRTFAPVRDALAMVQTELPLACPAS